MKKFVLAPDSFKGTMSSSQICNIMEGAILSHFSDAQIIKIPVADGGEGSVDCFLEAVGGEKVSVKVKGPLFDEIDSFYGILPDGTAVVEMAAAAGLPLIEDRKNPLKATTYGVGQLIEHAVNRGCTKIIVGIGGSATNDGGCGMAAALGIKFFDEKGEEFIPTGGNIDKIAKIDMSGRLKGLENCKFEAMCDVDNPLTGPNGASAIFGPQKGADEKMVELLDKNLGHMAEVLKRDFGLDVDGIPGAGGAGGLGAGVVAYLGGELKRGINVVLDTVKFEELIKDADMVLTGEGKIDGQSLRGKVVIGISRRAKVLNVPVIAVVGDIGDGMDQAYEEGVTAVMSINRVAVPFEKARLRSESDMDLTVDTLMRLLKVRGKN